MLLDILLFSGQGPINKIGIVPISRHQNGVEESVGILKIRRHVSLRQSSKTRPKSKKSVCVVTVTRFFSFCSGSFQCSGSACPDS